MRLIIEEQRETARAEDRSVRLTLQEIHAVYHFSGSPQSFVRAHHRHAVEDIQEAEPRLQSQARRFEDIRNLERYFAALLRNVVKANEERRANDRAYELRTARKQQDRLDAMRRDALRRKRLQEQPELHLEDGLDFVAEKFRPDDQVLLAAAEGIGTAAIREALQIMRQDDPCTVLDRPEASWKRWRAKNVGDEPKLLAVRKAFERKLHEAVRPDPCSRDLLKDKMGILSGTRGRLPIRQTNLRN